MGSDGMMGFGMGFGWMGIVFWVVVIVLIVVLVKYLMTNRGDKD